MRLFAYAYRNGEIGVGHPLPAGALPLGWMPDDFTEEELRGMARRAYDDTLLVPGVPEAADEAAAFDAFMTWRNRLVKPRHRPLKASEAGA